jgi:two-component system, chemotaxis family, chemotaxis protein CheY
LGSAPDDFVLIVEDDDEIRSLLSELLRDRGYAVREASHGADAIDVMRDATPCAVLLDLMMPHVSGWQVLDEMGADPRLTAVPVCVISANPQGVPLHVTVLRKPVRFADVRRFVESKCRRPEP